MVNWSLRSQTSTNVIHCLLLESQVKGQSPPSAGVRVRVRTSAHGGELKLNYTNPIIVINCWENSALIAPKQQAQLYTALMWILGNQLVDFHMKELIWFWGQVEGDDETSECLSDKPKPSEPFNKDFPLSEWLSSNQRHPPSIYKTSERSLPLLPWSPPLQQTAAC